MRRFITHSVKLAALATIAGCGIDATSAYRPMSADQAAIARASGSTARVVITPHSAISVIAGNTLPLSAIAYNFLGSVWNTPIYWTSRDTTLATVSSTGLVSGLAVGSLYVTANIREQIDSVLVSVIPVPVKSVTVSAQGMVAIGASTQAAAQTLDSAGNVLSGRAIAWSSRAPGVAVVSSTGLVTALTSGSAVIDATTGSIVGSATVTVPIPSKPKTVTVGLALTTVPASTSTQASAVVRDSAGNVLSGQVMVWSSANSAIATVSSSGLVTSVSAGSTSISASTGGVSGAATLTVTVPPGATFTETPATLPRTYINSTAPAAPASGGVIINVPSGGNLQAAINAANPGDVIQLANGAVFTGNFVLPNKNSSSSNWITIRPQNMSGVPAEGSRMTKSVAAGANLPVILTTSSAAAIATMSGAHHYRLIGLEVTYSAPVSLGNYGLVLFGDGSSAQSTLSSVPHDLVLDRMYIHGTSTNLVRRCVALNSAVSAVVDSYLSDCHEVAADAQAIAGWNGPGPFKIVNNYLEASGENVMFGGSDPAIQYLVPSDIEIRHNHFSRPTSWNGVWLVKNLLEFKNGQRVLVEGNLFENNWASGQNGVAIAIKSSNQNNTAPWSVSQDITFRFNLIRNVGGGFNVAGSPDPFGPTTIDARRISVMDNVISGINTGMFAGSGDGFLLIGDLQDLTIAHNTIVAPTRSGFWFSYQTRTPIGPTTRTTVRDNVIGGGSYGLIGDGANGQGAFTTYAPGGFFAGNVFVLGSGGYGPGNYFAGSINNIGFLSAAGADYHLLSTSPYRGKATDGRDPGADVDAVNTAIAGVIVP